MTKEVKETDANWNRILSESVDDVREVGDLLRLTKEELEELVEVQEIFPFFVNPYYLSLIQADDPNDPIRRMCVPSVEEFVLAGLMDTSKNSSGTILPGLQHDYDETALVLCTNRCAVYCRHCFRRRATGLSDDEIVRDIDEIATYVDAHPEITNVLLSGGDALMNDNETILRYLEAFAEIDHVRSLRLGTRMPVVLPQRITGDEELTAILTDIGSRKQLNVVTQFNHPAEVTPHSRAAVRALLQAGVPVRNQTVLLNGVNDDPQVLAQLMDDLVGIGVVPYYVFQCRPTSRVKNRFQVPLQRGCRIVEQSRAHLNGLAKSFRYVMPHDLGKIEILGLLNEEAAGNGTPSELKPLLLMFHQAKDRELIGKPFPIRCDTDTSWLSDMRLRLAFLQQNKHTR